MGRVLIHIEPYREAMAPAARDFNRRLDEGGEPRFIRLPETSVPGMLRRPGDTANAAGGFSQECFLALEENIVRGGYILYRQVWSFHGTPVTVANPMRPISESVIDRGYGAVALLMTRDALRRQPLQFGMGLDGPHDAASKMLKALHWSVRPVPLYFRVLNGPRFVGHFQPLRKNRAMALVMDAMAISGLAWAGVKAAGFFADFRGQSAAAERVDRFSDWADRLWEQAQHVYSVLPWRDSAVLNELFGQRPELICLKITAGERVAGWAVLDRVASSGGKFGGMSLYSILDCLSLPEDARTVIGAAVRYLARMGADMVISYQTHPAWQKALSRSGFFHKLSTFSFAASPELARRIQAADATHAGLHLNRGSGDVPVCWNPSRTGLGPAGCATGAETGLHEEQTVPPALRTDHG